MKTLASADSFVRKSALLRVTQQLDRLAGIAVEKRTSRSLFSDIFEWPAIKPQPPA